MTNKKPVALCLALVLALAAPLTGCERQTAPQATGPEHSRTYSALAAALTGEDYYLSATLTIETKGFAASTGEYIVAISGDRTYSRTVQSALLYMDGIVYSIDYGAGVFFATGGLEAPSLDRLHPSLVEQQQPATGSLTIKGTEYEYEEFLQDGIAVKYCFAPGGSIKYIVTDSEVGSMTIELFELSSSPLEQLFELPESFMEMSMDMPTVPEPDPTDPDEYDDLPDDPPDDSEVIDFDEAPVEIRN